MLVRGVSNVKGVHNIKGLRYLNTKPGAATESGRLLRLYQLSVERDSLRKKLARVKQQKAEAETRLSEMTHTIHSVVHALEGMTGEESHVSAHDRSRSRYFQY